MNCKKCGLSIGDGLVNCGHNSPKDSLGSTQESQDLLDTGIESSDESSSLFLSSNPQISQIDSSRPDLCLGQNALPHKTNIGAHLSIDFYHELTNSLKMLSLEDRAKESKRNQLKQVPNSKKHIQVTSQPVSGRFKLPKKDIKAISSTVCAYCGIDCPQSLIECKVCKKWFCNRRGNISSSHAINHLITAKHKEVALHKNGILGNRNLKCSNCGCDNIFVLGFIPGKTKSEIVLLCRQPCHNQKMVIMSDQSWNPLISELVFISRLIRKTSSDEKIKSRSVSAKEIKRLEILWKEGITGEPVKETEYETKPQKVLLRYSDGTHYRNTFSSLVKMESDYGRTLKDNTRIEWGVGRSNNIIALFKMSQSDESDTTNLYNGDELRLIHMGEQYPWVGVGWVIKIPNQFDEEVCIEMKCKKGVPIHLTNNFVVEFVWESVSSERILSALKTFGMKVPPVSRDLYDKLLGHNYRDKSICRSIPEQLSAPNLPELNESQKNAVKHSIQRTLSLIQGPPGTGKTVTSATIVYHLATTGKKPVLVSAQSNTAVDQLTEKIHKTGLKVVRVYAKTREEMESPLKFLALHHLIPDIPELKSLEKLKQKNGKLSEKDEKKLWALKALKRRSEMKVLREADVICCTCIGAADSRIAQFQFDSILIDEAMQATEPECLVPIVLGAKQLILVGDHKQLGPVVRCKIAERAGLSQSLFERLVALKIRPLCLEIQYRMHPSLSQFPSKVFYDGLLQNGVNAEQRKMKSLSFRWPQPNQPIFFYNCEGKEEIPGSGISYLNRSEASFVEKIVTHFLKSGIKAEQIGVITPYEGQRSYLVSYMKRFGQLNAKRYEKIEIASVNAFQGREKDFIIMSCVRSNLRQKIGFLNDRRRLNVALTRARYGLIIVGNPYTLSSDSLWNDLLTYYKKNKLLVEGSLKSLKESHKVLIKSRKY